MDSSITLQIQSKRPLQLRKKRERFSSFFFIYNNFYFILFYFFLVYFSGILSGFNGFIFSFYDIVFVYRCTIYFLINYQVLFYDHNFYTVIPRYNVRKAHKYFFLKKAQNLVQFKSKRNTFMYRCCHIFR